MRPWVAVAFVAALGALDGCSSEPPRPAPPRTRGARGAAPAAVANTGPLLYDADGNLLATEAAFLGFPIPAGFERTHAVDGIFVYASRDVPYAKLGSYVEAHITAGTPQAIGSSGLAYARVHARGAEANSRPLQIRVMQTRNGVQLWLRDATPVVFPPGTTEAMRVEEVNRAWREEGR